MFEYAKAFSIPVWYSKPKTDNEKLLNLQYDIKMSNSRKAANAMYKLGYTIALKMINKQIGTSMSEEDKAEKAHNAITYIMARYISCPTFEIKESFTAYIYLRVKHELKYRRKVDSIVQFMPYEDVLRCKE